MIKKESFVIKTVCFALAACLALTTASFCTASAEPAKQLMTDIELDLMYSLSIIDDKTVTNEKITVDEAAQLLLNLREPYADRTETPLEDALKNGIADNSFRGGVTLEKFTGAILRVMYYNQYLEVTGFDEMQLAKRIGLLDRISVNGRKSAVSKAEALKLIYNALFAQPCKFGQIEIDENTTYMEAVLNVCEIQGIMTANDKTGLYSAGGIKNSVKIGDTEYKGAEYSELLGYNVKAYIDDDDRVLYAYDVEKNEVTRIKSVDLDEIDGNTVKYWGTDDKTKKLNVKNGVPVIYNNCYLGSWGADAVNKKISDGYGYIDYTVLDNNGDKEYDVVFMKKYESLYLTGVHSNDERVGNYDSLHQKWVYFIEGDIFVMEDGSAASVENVSDRTVLSFCENDEDTQALLNGNTDRNPMVFSISDEFMSGRADSVSPRTGREYLTVEGEKFEMNREYGITAAKALADNIIGRDITAYTDINGRIVYYEINTGIIYVCIAGTEYNEFEEKGRIKLFNTKSEMEVRDISKNIKVYDPNTSSALVDKNGAAANKITGIELFLKNLSALQKGILKVRYNSKGELASVNLPRRLAYGERGVDNEFNYVTYAARDSANETGWTSRYGILNDMYIMLGSTAAGVTTQFLKPFGGGDEDWSCVLGTDDGISKYGDVDLYNIDADFCFNMTFSAADDASQNGVRMVHPGTLPAVVNNSGEILLEDGNVGQYVEVFYNGQMVEYKTAKTDLKSHENEGVAKRSLADLGFGDVVQFDISNNEIVGFRVLLDYSEGKYGRYKLSDPYTGGVDDDSSTSHYINSDYRLGYGKIERHGTDFVELNIKGLVRNFWRSRFRTAVLVDTESETIKTLGEMHETKEPKSMFYKFDWGPDQIMVVYQ